jgi:hypothetical protein
MRNVKLASTVAKLHIPLIQNRQDSTEAQDVAKKKAELGTPLFLSLNQDIAAWS